MSELKITSVHYSRLINLGDYENEKIGASATVEEGQDPVETMVKLQAWVYSQLSDKALIRTARGELQNLEWELEQKRNDIHSMRDKWQRAKDFLTQHGIDTSLYSDLPF